MRRKPSLAILFCVIIVDLIGFGVMIPIMPYYAESFGASATILGLLLTSYAAMQFVFAPIWGRYSDRRGRRRVMLLTIAGTAAALCGVGLADSLVWLFAARLLGGVFGANISVATAYVTDITEEKDRTKWMGMIGASFGVGFILGPAIGGLLAPFGYRVPMFFAAGLAAVNFVFALFALGEPEIKEPSTVESVRMPRSASSLMTKILIAGFLFTFAVTQLETVFAFFMIDRFAWDASGVAYIMVFMALIMVVIQGGAIRPLAERFSDRQLLLSGSLLLTLSLGLVPWVPTIASLMVVLAVASMGRALCHPALLSSISRTAGSDQKGSVMGSFQAASSLARVAGPLVAGVAYDLSLAAPFVIATLAMVAVMSISRLMPAR